MLFKYCVRFFVLDCYFLVLRLFIEFIDNVYSKTFLTKASKRHLQPTMAVLEPRILKFEMPINFILLSTHVDDFDAINT